MESTILFIGIDTACIQALNDLLSEDHRCSYHSNSLDTIDEACEWLKVNQTYPVTAMVSDKWLSTALITSLHRISSYVQIIVLTASEYTGMTALDAGACDYLLVQELTAGNLRRALAHADRARHDTEQRLQSEAHLRKLTQAVHQSPTSIVITDRDGMIEYVNPKFTQLTGYTSNEAVGQNPRFLQSGYTSAVLYEEMWRRLLRGEAWQGEFLNQKKNGDLYWEYASICGVKDDAGNITHFVAVKEDITRNKRIEQELERTNEHLLLLNRVIAVSNISLDLEVIIQLLCRELAEIFEVPQVLASLVKDGTVISEIVAESGNHDLPSFVGRSCTLTDNAIHDYLRRYSIPLIISETDSDTPYLEAREAMLGTVPGASLFVPLTMRGKVVGSIAINAHAPRTFSDAEFLLAASAAHAISQSLENSVLHRQLSIDNAKLEQIVADRTLELRSLNERMSAILNSASDAIILVTRDHRIEMANPAFGTMFGVSANDYPRMTLPNLEEYHECGALGSAVEMVFSEGVARRLEVRARRKDGSVFDADVALARIDQGQQLVLCSLRDITELKQVERIKDRFISMVSHELRTPITTIVLSAGALRQYFDRMDDEQRKQAIVRTDQQAQVLAELVETILDLSRLEGRRGRHTTEIVDVSRVAASAINEFRPIAEAKGQTLTIAIPPAPVTVRGETADFARIWRNLLSNAIKYTPCDGSISVELGRVEVRSDRDMIPAGTMRTGRATSKNPVLTPGEYLVGQVVDSGHGIPEEDFVRLFDRFQRGWASQSSIPGTGLGLALVREILHLYGGEIEVQSALGNGSTFKFWIPMRAGG